jgi:hypothetical protein
MSSIQHETPYHGYSYTREGASQSDPGLVAARWGLASRPIGRYLRVVRGLHSTQYAGRLTHALGYSASLGHALGTGRLAGHAERPRAQRPAAPLFKGGRGGGERIAQASGSDHAASYRLLGPDRSLEGNLQCTTPVLLQPAKGAARFCRPCARRAQRQITGRTTSPEPASDKPRCGKDLRPSVSGRDPSDTALNTRAAGPSRDGSLPSSHVLYPRASDHVCACFPVQCRVVAPLPGRRLSDRLLVFPAVHPCIPDPQRDAAVYPVPW